MKDNEICVIGMGYVGLTLIVVLADKGFRVTGIDQDERLVNALNKGVPPFFESGVSELLANYINKQICIRSTYPARLPQTVVICVSTPIDWQSNLGYKARGQALLPPAARLPPPLPTELSLQNRGRPI